MFDTNRMADLENFDVEVYFKALLTVSKSDGSLDEVEVEYLKDQATLMNYDINSIINKDINFSELHIESTSNFTKKVIIRDCISIANIDNHYDDKEKIEIAKVGEKIGVSKEDIKKIEDWLFEYWGIIEKGEKIMTS